MWPEVRSGLVGLAVVNYHLWPVVMRPWGKNEDCYKWPYYFSTSPERQRAADELADDYAALADCMAREHDKSVALICMEELDEPFARKVHQRMVHAGRARLFSAREYSASQMTTLLRSLDLLVTSRYHGCVLSLAAQVPELAVGHDLRLKTIYDELGFTDQFFAIRTRRTCVRRSRSVWKSCWQIRRSKKNPCGAGTRSTYTTRGATASSSDRL